MLESLWPSLALTPLISVLLVAAWSIYLLVLAIWIIWDKREPVATLSWLLSLAALPVVGLVIYYLVGPLRIRRQRLRRARARAALAAAPLPGDGVNLVERQVAQLARRTTGLMPKAMRQPQLLRDGAETYEAMLEAIAGARHHIHLASYIFDPDTTGRRFLDALVAKAREGVTVRLLIDSVGSSGTRNRFFAPLRQAGGEVAWFHPVRLRFPRRPALNQRSHRKLLIVDGTLGFTGGVNITDTEDPRLRPDAYCDLHLRFRGAAVQGLQLTFIEDWAYVTGQALCEPVYWPPLDVGGVPALVIPSGPDSPWEAFHRVAVESIHDATERVWLVTPYFVPSEAARMALTNAALCGVDVRLMLPRRADSRLVSAAARSYYDELLDAGVRIFEYQPNLLHAKTLLVDRRHLLIGSANFDYRSFRVNFELSTLVSDPELAQAMEAAWNDYATRCVEIHAHRHYPHWRRLGDATARLFSPLL